MIRRLAVVCVLLLIVGVAAYNTQGQQTTYSCAAVSGGYQLTDRGITVAQRVGEGLQRWADASQKEIREDDLLAAVKGAIRKVVLVWLKAAILTGHGKKLDPEIIRIQEKAKAERDAAESACTPCPTEDQQQNPGDGQDAPDPRAYIPAAQSTLKGASLAADALRRAGFPTSEIPMGVAVAKLESGFNPQAINPLGIKGMWQIHYKVHPELSETGWSDPYKNARDAFSVWKAAGGSWSPWSTASAARRQVGKVAPNQGTARVELPDDGTRRQGQGCTPVVGSESEAEGNFVSADFSIYSNPRTVAQAIEYMDRMVRNRTPIPSGRCLHYVGAAYGYQGTHTEDGSHYAIEHWQITPAKYKHPGADGSKAPRGSLLYWNTGPGRAGHIAIAAGNGMVYSTDAPTRGLVGLVPFSYFKGYGEMVGYADPYFPGQTKVKASSYAVAA